MVLVTTPVPISLPTPITTPSTPLNFFATRRTAAAMDLSAVDAALAAKSFSSIGQLLDDLLLQVAGMGAAHQDDWPYALHLLAHLYVNDLNSARFLWKSVPAKVKEGKPEVAAVWRIGQRLWDRDYAGVYEAVRGFEWSAQVSELVTGFSEIYTQRMLQLLVSAYSTISVADVASFLGMSEAEATKYVVNDGWTLDPCYQMLIVKKSTIASEQKVDASRLQRLTEYVFHLEH